MSDYIDDLVGIEPTPVPKDRAPLRVEATAEAIASPLRVLLFEVHVNRKSSPIHNYTEN
jgi:hypothetical protein